MADRSVAGSRAREVPASGRESCASGGLARSWSFPLGIRTTRFWCAEDAPHCPLRYASFVSLLLGERGYEEGMWVLVSSSPFLTTRMVPAMRDTIGDGIDDF